MKYCSECGGKARLRRIRSDPRRRFVCTSCGLTHYQNPKIIVCCLAYRNGKLLVCRRAHDPGRGKWTVPSGFLEVGETLQEAAARETFEEARVRVGVRSLALHSLIDLVEIGQVAIAFRTRLSPRQMPRPGPECLEVAFMSESDIATFDIAWRDALHDQPERFFRELRTGHFTVQLSKMRAPAPLNTVPMARPRRRRRPRR